jgi:hypothetical protein
MPLDEVAVAAAGVVVVVPVVADAVELLLVPADKARADTEGVAELDPPLVVEVVVAATAVGFEDSASGVDSLVVTLGLSALGVSTLGVLLV